ncbi:histidinol-phosphate transaminase [Aquimarina sp. W85]|uniref:histidinol-phosphate transaminase n=1 Tax=Aquimarina rhodophyticola TaxID=3342246 RepID=UPI00366FD171
MTQFKLNTLVRDNIKTLQAYSSARDEYVSDGSSMIFLDANENPFENGVNRYPDPQQRAVKSLLSKQKDISIDNILLGNGSDEVLDLLFRTFCEPKRDNIITLPPTYGMYKVLADINAIENREILLNSNFEPDVSKILDSVDQYTKMIFLCSPNNPTGNCFAEEHILKILNEFNGLVIIDEAYIDFASGSSWIQRLDDFPNLVITQTLSKAYGMAGIRLGVCYASREIIALLSKVKPPYNINELTQQKALDRLSSNDQVVSEINNILRERARLERSLAAIDFVKTIYPSEANFILVEVDAADLRYNQLIKHGIVVRNRSSQPLCDNTLRFSIGTIEENSKLIETLKNISEQ